MIRALIRKEVRQLLPVIVAFAALLLWGAVDSFLLHPADTHSWSKESWLLGSGDRSWNATLDLIIGIVIAYSLFPGEHAQKTIDFLYSLPLRRWTLFLTKYLVGVGIQVMLELCGTGLTLLQHALNPDSFERRMLQTHVVLLQMGCDVAMPLVCVAYGLLLSYFRRLGWIFAAMLLFGLEVMERLRPAWRIVNIKALMTVQHDGLTPHLDGRAWALHAALAAAALLLSGHLWLGRQERFVAFYDRLVGSRNLRRVGGGLAVAAAALLLGGLLSTGGRASKEPAASGQPAARVLTFATEHFDFTYPEPFAERARVIIQDADRAYTDVKRWLGAPDTDRIVADMTEDSDEHLGIAGWSKMRIALGRSSSPAILRHVLYHETTHVLAAALSPGMSSARASETRFFAEGLADHVAYQLLGDPDGERARARQVAALAYQQFHLRFADLLDPKAFLRRQDEFLFYPLGELFTAALVATCGQQSVATLLRALASEATPQSLSGFDLWRHTLQAQRCDIDRVLGLFERKLRALLPSATALPVATARLEGREGDVLIFAVTVRAPSAGSWPVVLRLRPDADAPPESLQMARAQVATGETVLLRSFAPPGAGQHIEFQVGAKLGPRTAFFTRWQSTLLP